ncbi:MAG TPA: TIGR03790 family protein [Telluria sp.]
MHTRARLAVLLALLALAGAAQPQAPRSGLAPSQLAIVINDADPNSVAVGAYYRKARNIPASNVVHVHIPGAPQRISAARFALLKKEIDGQLGEGIEAVLMVWTAPYAVECNSITSAFTMGFDGAQCRRTCDSGRPNPYFNSAATRPYTGAGMRLSMLLPTESVAGAKAVIGRGVAAGFRTVPATAYYLVTTETARNVRARFYPPAARLASKKIATRVLKADALEGADDIIIYQTGMAQVGKLETLGFRPGALADHLTSLGGDLLGQSQMSILRWLDAGATASYGTVSEPCNHWQKFPHPSILLRHYAGGASAIEAYWKSVAWPTQGLFVGEPLSAPYRR